MYAYWVRYTLFYISRQTITHYKAKHIGYMVKVQGCW